MTHIITETCKYILIVLFAIYTYYSYVVLVTKNEEKAKKLYRKQFGTMMTIHLVANLVIWAVTQDLKYIIFYGAQLVLIVIILIIYRVIYRHSARLIVNHMCMLMIIGFIMLTRLNLDLAVKQFEIAGLAVIASLLVPLIISKLKILRKFTWLYAILGIIALGAVLALGAISGGAHLSFSVAGFTFQPSEFVKIVFVFFVACALYEKKDFYHVFVVTIAAAIHVLILVASTDLGAALILFVTYVVMLYVATQNPLYFFGGFGAGGIAGVIASKIFRHVRVRIEAYKDPFADIEGKGWQVAQSWFAIGTGGWFGIGLFQGKPTAIPVRESDFIFAAICEEMGGIFGICIILVCFSCFIMMLNIALQIKDMFYKLIALGLGTLYGTQVVLNIGGVIKFIPSTGVTLPLVSYGGSSILCTIVIFAIVQGLYITRYKEGELDELKEKESIEQSASDRDDRLRVSGGREEVEESSKRTRRKKKSKFDEGYDELD